MKTCRACGVEKPLEEFRRSRAERDGLHAYCKPCHSETNREWRRRSACKREYDEKRRAQRAVYKAVRAGRLTRPDTCEQCGALDAIQAHHDDYSQRFKVRWLCPSCHRRLHVALQDALAAAPATEKDGGGE